MNLRRPNFTFYYSLSLLLLALLPSSVFSDTLAPTPPLAPFEVDYDISRNGIMVVHMKRRLLQLNNGEYRFESTSRATKIVRLFLKDRINEHSLWQYHQQQLRPLHYHYQRRGGKKNKHIELDFDWQQGTVSDSKRSPIWSSALPPNTSDRLLYQLQLMLDLQANKETFSYTIADSGKFRHYDFTLVGTETIRLPLGHFNTVKLSRSTGKRATTIWFAPTLNYLPVRIEHREKDGSRMRADATRVKGLPFVKKVEDQK